MAFIRFLLSSLIPLKYRKQIQYSRLSVWLCQWKISECNYHNMMPNPCTALYFKEKGLMNGMSINIFNYMRKSEIFRKMWKDLDFMFWYGKIERQISCGFCWPYFFLAKNPLRNQKLIDFKSTREPILTYKRTISSWSKL